MSSFFFVEKRQPKIFGFKNVMEKETKKFSLSSKIFGKNNIEALVISKRLKLP